MQMRLLAAEAVAREAGALARKRFNEASFKVGFKGPQDYLTEVDGETEDLISRRLQAAFPGDGFIGEETGGRAASGAQATWVVDPIDGTVNFARGVPHFCVSIACVAEGEIEVGVIYDPMCDELFSARRGFGALLNGLKIQVSAATALAESVVEVGWNMRGGAPKYVDLIRHVALWGAAPFRSGSGALGLAYVAAGRRDGYLEHHINAWDCLAGILLVREAGGYTSDFLAGDGLTKGNPLIACAPGLRSSIIAASPDRGDRAVKDLVLTKGDARAEIARLGAEARAWSVGGRDLLWPGDPATWPEISPILYPVVGWTRDGKERVDGRSYALKLHGFARFESFTVERCEQDFVRLVLTDNAATRAVYPFAFAFAVEYRLTERALGVTLEVANPGERAAPYACGLHPGFRWPFGDQGREGARVRFEKEERPDAPMMAPGGLIGRAKKAIPLTGRDLPLSDALFANDAVCLLDCASRELAFIDHSGASIAMEFPDFQHAALWTRPGAPYLCLECWTGYSDPEGFEGDLFEKPSMRVLEPGAKARHAARFVYQA